MLLFGMLQMHFENFMMKRVTLKDSLSKQCWGQDGKAQHAQHSMM
jgi:hypothetical protein